MKQFGMTDRKGRPGKKPAPQSRPTDVAFDKWLNRSLHEMFDGIVNEPVPDEILKIVLDDKQK